MGVSDGITPLSSPRIKLASGIMREVVIERNGRFIAVYKGH